MHINCKAVQLKVEDHGFEPGIAPYQLHDLGPTLNLSELLSLMFYKNEDKSTYFIGMNAKCLAY